MEIDLNKIYKNTEIICHRGIICESDEFVSLLVDASIGYEGRLSESGRVAYKADAESPRKALNIINQYFKWASSYNGKEFNGVKPTRIEFDIFSDLEDLG